MKQAISRYDNAMKTHFTLVYLLLFIDINHSHATVQATEKKLPHAAKQCAISPQAAYQQIMVRMPAANNQKTVKPSEKPRAKSSSNQKTKAQSSELININTATVAELTQLPHIGVKKAQAIVAYRQRQGGFSSVAEITNIKGIGKKTLAKFEHRLTIY